MKCTDSHIGQKLHDYFTGHLAPEENQQVEKHVQECKACRTDLATMRLLGPQVSVAAESLYEEHLSENQLASYYRERSELTPDEITRIEKHLEACDRCAYDYDFLRDLESDLLASVKPELDASPLWERVLGWLVVPLRKPALAYFLLALTIYPAARYLMTPPTDTPSQGSADVHQLREGIRSGDRPPVVIRPQVEALVRVDIPLYHATDLYRYDYYVAGVDTEPQSIAPFLDYSRPGTVGLILDTDGLPDGQYALSVIETNRIDPTEISEYTFLFILTTDR